MNNYDQHELSRRAEMVGQQLVDQFMELARAPTEERCYYLFLTLRDAQTLVNDVQAMLVIEGGR